MPPDLQDRRYTPAAWLRFLQRAFRRSIDDVRREPGLLRSALQQSACLEAMALTALYWQGRRRPAGHRFRQARQVSLGLLLQQGFVILHLGLARPSEGAARSATLGLANFLTSLRGVCAVLLLSSDPADMPLFALLCATGSVTDALDGAVARRFRARSRLGQVLDPATDSCFYSAAVLTAVRRGTLPHWFGRLVLARFLAPAGTGFYSYCRWAQPLEAKHTVWGKLASALLALLVLLGIRRPHAARLLCLPTSAVLTMAGALQCARALRVDGRNGFPGWPLRQPGTLAGSRTGPGDRA